ncbi:MAG: PEGA domain-containing protein [Fibrobacterota bacterium]|nr:PEGA domain-containing protein [Fibrobacterota bacterium]
MIKSPTRRHPLRLSILAGVLLLLPSSGWRDASLHAEARRSFAPAGTQPVYGLLWLQIDPDRVDIALDGLYLDKDVWLVSVAPGSHTLHVRKAGFKAYDTRFDIAAGQNVRVDVRLEPMVPDGRGKTGSWSPSDSHGRSIGFQL